MGQPLHLPCLFVHITVNDYVPNNLNDFANALANPIDYQNARDEMERLREAQLSILGDEGQEVKRGLILGDNDSDICRIRRGKVDTKKEQ